MNAVVVDANLRNSKAEAVLIVGFVVLTTDGWALTGKGGDDLSTILPLILLDEIIR